MSFLPLSGKVLKLLSRYNYFFIYLILALTFISCERRTDETVTLDPQKNTLNFLQTKYNPNIKWADIADSLAQGKNFLAAMEEVDSGKVWGIKFYLFDPLTLPLKPVFESPVFDGSLEQSIVKFVKIDGLNYLYYNSTDYFLGASGGEQYIYIVDFINKCVFSGHLGAYPDGEVKLFITPSASPGIRNFIINEFRKDFPDFSIVKKDLVFE